MKIASTLGGSPRERPVDIGDVAPVDLPHKNDARRVDAELGGGHPAVGLDGARVVADGPAEVPAAVGRRAHAP